MNPLTYFEQINFYPFNFFNYQDGDMRDPEEFSDLNSNNFDIPL